MNKSLEEIVFELIELVRPYIEGLKSVLDIGTGSSIPIHVIAEIFPDISYSTIDVVDIRQKKKLPFKLYDGYEIPFDVWEFDGALLNETLHHCENPWIILSEAKRVAKSVYVIEHFPNLNTTLEELVETEIYALMNFNMHFSLYNPFTEQSLNKLFEKAGLKIKHKVKIPYYGKREIEKYLFVLE